MKDNLVTCKRCGSDACYEQHLEGEITTWLCMGCGFTTSTEMKENTPVTINTLETSPELYKDLLFVDKDGHHWFPSTITLPKKGMVFIDGTSTRDWKWKAVKTKAVTEELRKKNNLPLEQEFTMDMANAKNFDKKNFMDALEVIGFYEA